MIRQNDPRRWKERADGRMIPEDHSAPANLSPNVKMEKIEHNDAPIDGSKMMMGIGVLVNVGTQE